MCVRFGSNLTCLRVYRLVGAAKWAMMLGKPRCGPANYSTSGGQLGDWFARDKSSGLARRGRIAGRRDRFAA